MCVGCGTGSGKFSSIPPVAGREAMGEGGSYESCSIMGRKGEPVNAPR